MSRVKDIEEAIDEMRKTDVTDGNLKQMQVAILAHIATSLAVIADKMTKEVTELLHQNMRMYPSRTLSRT